MIETAVPPKLADLARTVARLRDEEATAEATLTDARKALQAAESDLYEAMEQAEIPSARVEGLGLFTRSTQMYWNVKDQEAFFGWLKEALPNDFTSLVKPSIHWQTLRGFCNERTKAGHGAPPGVEPFPKPILTYRKEK